MKLSPTERGRVSAGVVLACVPLSGIMWSWTPLVYMAVYVSLELVSIYVQAEMSRKARGTE